jgi:hypothetical protein
MAKVNLSKDQQEFIENILATPYKGGVCQFCGKAQSHSLVYCSACGNTFFRVPNGTYFDVIQIAHNRIMQKMPLDHFRLDFVSAVLQRKLAEKDITRDQFVDYLINKLENYHG